MVSLPPRRENVMSMGRFRMSSWLCMFHFPLPVPELRKSFRYVFLVRFRFVCSFLSFGPPFSNSLRSLLRFCTRDNLVPG